MVNWLNRKHSTFEFRIGASGEKLQDRLTQALAVRAFLRALNRVPAYADFLAHAGATVIRTWSDVPVMDKDAWVKTYPPPATLLDGRVPAGQVDQSSGSTGAPSVWFRSTAEIEHTGLLMGHTLRSSAGNRPVSVINTFALGPWATGMTIHQALGTGCTMHAVGADIGRALDAIRIDAEVARASGERRVQLVCGYPPFLKLLGDHLKESGIDLSMVELWAVGGGEKMSPALRMGLFAAGFCKMMSSYGASDLTINIGAQDDWCIALEDACARNPELARELFGRTTVPAIFFYDPTQYFIEHVRRSSDEGAPVDQLLFTQLAEVTGPKIRYDLGDEGVTRPASEIREVLRRYGIQMPKRRHPLPVLAVFGRVGNAVTYRGAKVTPDHLLEVLSEVQVNGQPLAALVENYGLNGYEDGLGNPRLGFLLQLKKGVSKEQMPDDLLERIIDAIARRSQDFRAALGMHHEQQISVTLFEYNTGPDFHPNPNTKKQYIFHDEALSP